MPGSPVEDRKYFSPLPPSVTNRKELKNYNWPLHSKTISNKLFTLKKLIKNEKSY